MRLIAACFAVLLTAMPLAASERVERLMLKPLQLEQVVNILRDEGLAQAKGLKDTFLGGDGGGVL